MRKPIRIALILAGSIVAALVLLVLVSCVLFSPKYVYRCIANREGKTTDYLFFPERKITKSTMPYHYERNIDSAFNDLDIQYSVKGEGSVMMPRRTTIPTFAILRFII